MTAAKTAFSRKELDRTIWRIAIPCVVENLLTFAASLVIAAMIGRLTADEISAQSIGGRISGILTALFKGMGVGATIVLGLYFGRGEEMRCRRIGEQLLIIMAAAAVLLSLIAFLMPVPLLRIFTDDESFIALAVPYVRVAIWVVPFQAVSRIVTAVFNSRSNTKTPMAIAIGLNIVNAVLGYATIFKLGMGLMGAAISLTAANFFGMAAGLIALYGSNGLFRKLRRDGPLSELCLPDIALTLKTGFPASLETMMWSFASIIISRAMLTFDTTSYAGYQLASQVEEFLASPCFGFQVAATTLAAQCVGARDNVLARTYHKRILFWSAVVAAPLAGVLIFIPNLVMDVLTDKAAIAQIGAVYLILAGIGFIPQAMNMVDFGVLRAAGYKNMPLIVTVIGMWCIRVPFASLAAWVFHASIVMVFAGIVLDCTMRWVIGVGFIAVKKRKKATIWSEEENRNEI